MFLKYFLDHPPGRFDYQLIYPGINIIYKIGFDARLIENLLDLASCCDVTCVDYRTVKAFKPAISLALCMAVCFSP